MARKKRQHQRTWREIVLYVITFLVALSMALTYVLLAMK